MLARLIQQKVPIGTEVKFTLKNGQEISGILTEIGRDHVSLGNKDGAATILTELISAWEVLKKEVEENGQGKLDEKLPETPVEKVTSFADLELAVLKRIMEFDARFQNAKINIKTPDFTFPSHEIASQQDKDAVATWDRIKNRYEYAQKVHEFSPKFDRIRQIINDMKPLVERFPTSPSLKRHLGYAYYSLGNIPEAIKLYEEAAIQSQHAADWFNFSVLCLEAGKEEIACYTLEQVFRQTPLTEEQNAWYVYIGLVKKFNNYSALGKLFEKRKPNLSENELIIFLETGIYLLRMTGSGQKAVDLAKKWTQGQPLEQLAWEVFSQLEGSPAKSYVQAVSEFKKMVVAKTQPKLPQLHQGYIYPSRLKEWRGRNYSFLKDSSDGKTLFFHRSAIVDKNLLNKLDNLELGDRPIPVVFETTQSDKGPLAIQISLYRTIDEVFKLALGCAEIGEYLDAVSYIRQVLMINPNYPNADDLREKWQEYAQVSGVPKGSNPYARAKRVQLIEKDLERAAQFFYEAIAQRDNIESAVKDLATVLVKLGRASEAVEMLEKNRNKIRDQQSLDNMLINIYQRENQHDLAIALLQEKLEHTPTAAKKVPILWQIANCYLRQDDYATAEQTFRKIINLRPENVRANYNVALCLSKQGRYEEAEKLLNRILTISPDANAAQLLGAIAQAKTEGVSTHVDELIVETTLSEFAGELSRFAQFFLNQCDFQGVAPNRVKEDEQGQKSYTGSERDSSHDIERLENFAKEQGTRRPRDRAGFYLSAARISQEVGDDPNQFYRHLCRSFASRGDAAVGENRHLDAVREWYCEALSVYDGYRQPRDHGDKYVEQDAVNALCRFLYSYLSRDSIPTSPPQRDERQPILKQQLQYIDNTVEEVVSKHPQPGKVFEAITYLVFRSRFAANRILKLLYDKATLQAMAVQFLGSQDISVPLSVTRIRDFIQLWNELGMKRLDDMRTVSSELRFLNNVELTTAWLENAIRHVKDIEYRPVLDLDQQRAGQLRKLFETCLELCKQSSFEEQERLCIQLDDGCQHLLMEIEDSPTKLSVEEVYSVVQSVKDKAKGYLEELYVTSMPQITLRTAIESYVPDNRQQIEVQLALANSRGRSPAESLELIVREDESFFMVNTEEIKIGESLRGGEQRILEVPIRITDQTLKAQAFSMAVYAQYRTRLQEIKQTPVYNFSIKLYPEEDFEEIPNPYAAYAEGGAVLDPKMFYGRDELIKNIARAVADSHTQSKCVIIFGQKRAGKSSILYHLKRQMETEKDLVIFDLGNIGAILDQKSDIPFAYQLLVLILEKLRCAAEDRGSNGLTPLNISFPSVIEFYNHPTPLVLFKQIFDEYKRQASKDENRHNLRIVIMIDEFSYIYGQIVSGRISELFMKNWKAILQENYFSAVLAGQDVTPKFKERFPNEFGTTQDERVTYLKPEDATKLIDEPIRIGGRQGESRYRERAIEQILELTAGSPYYIQIFCHRLVEYMNRKHYKWVTEANVEQVKNELIQGVNALGLDKFDNLISSGDTSRDAISDEDTLEVLKAVALNSKSGPCHYRNITCKTSLPINVILDDLVTRDVLKREREHCYQICVGLFKEWLLTHYGG